MLAAGPVNGWSQQTGAGADRATPERRVSDSRLLSPATAGISARELIEADTNFM
jgi:hypothetical protein